MGIGESILGLALSGLPIGVQIALLLADKILSILNNTEEAWKLTVGQLGSAIGVARQRYIIAQIYWKSL